VYIYGGSGKVIACKWDVTCVQLKVHMWVGIWGVAMGSPHLPFGGGGPHMDRRLGGMVNNVVHLAHAVYEV
jgi:hypothetical protein